MYKPVLTKQARSQALLNQRPYKRQIIRELVYAIAPVLIVWLASTLAVVVTAIIRHNSGAW